LLVEELRPLPLPLTSIRTMTWSAPQARHVKRQLLASNQRSCEATPVNGTCQFSLDLCKFYPRLLFAEIPEWVYQDHLPPVVEVIIIFFSSYAILVLLSS
jgi:hypothetical protein